MSKLFPQERDDLLQALTDMGGAGQAEKESADAFCRRFFPVPEHLRAFAPDVTLIIGERGSGKSELFRAVMEFNLLGAIAHYAPRVTLPPLESERTIWIQAYPIGSGFPDARGLKAFLAEGQQPERVQQLWFAYLVRVLGKQLSAIDRQNLQPILGPQGGDVAAVTKAFDQAAQAPVLALDRLDETLYGEDRWVFVGYDELETLGGYDWQVMGDAISGLVSFWAAYARRWRRLRAKLFMRTDLFRRNAASLSADLPKLAANRAELSWSDRNLYAMLVKRIANTSESLRQYCGEARVKFKPCDDRLGWMPEFAAAEDAQPLVKRVIGEYMGANQNKGLTFNWLLDHVRDGQDKAYPRALVRLIEQAAVNEKDSPKAVRDRLLHPTSVRRAIDEVSRSQVRQAIAGEWPWLEGVKERTQRHMVPMDRRELVNLLRRNWKEPWNPNPDIRPPAEDARNLAHYLVELGIMRERSRDRLDAPDLYQSGLGLTRHGGVRRY